MRWPAAMPTRADRQWALALAEHETAIAELRRVVSEIASDRWHVAAAEGKWSPAEEVLHVTIAYEFARANIGGGPGMRLRVSSLRAALLRWLLLPRILRTGRFPRDVRAPREVRPQTDEAGALDAVSLLARLDRAADAAAAELAAAAGRSPSIRMVHAYFGPLRPLVAIRMLAAHTRHHARRLARRGGMHAAGTRVVE